MKFLAIVFIIGILASLSILKNKKIKNLFVLTIVFSLLVGCNLADKSSVDTSSNYIISSNEKLSDEKEINEESGDLEESDSEDLNSEDNAETISKGSNNQESYDYENDSDNNEDSSAEYIGETVYIADGNSYYHKISNCKYLEGAKTEKIVLTSDINKYECNCFTNPVEYKSSSNHHSKKHNSSKKHSSGQTVYIANGNSYYHKSSSCKFIKGADVKEVDINNVGSKHPCNCIKY